ncbi:hypothetical protein [Kitasatospora sp. LaBMicrA B282]|uniref:hypothetical protein n=1 Tax=Kitasatospora sp. LaBMicrA B282 TaxID=3420949 RepID=UPI003D11685F
MPASALPPRHARRRRRRIRRRVVWGAVGTAGAAAVLLSACGGGGAAGPAAAASTVAAAVAAPTTGPSAAPPPPAPAAASSASPAAALLTAAELPDGAVQQWKPLAAPHTEQVDHAVQVNECSSVTGATTWQQLAYVSTFQTPAEQDVFTFADASAARAAYQSLLTQMGSCQDQSRALQTKSKIPADAVVTQTATTAQGTAWSRQWTGVEGISASGPQTDHLYAVQQGSLLAVVHFDEWASTHAAPYSTGSDGDLLTAVATRLG